MKIELKSRIQNLIQNYKKVTGTFLEELKKWEADSLYSSDHRQDMIREAKAKMRTNDEDFNRQLKAIIQAEKESIMNSTIKKPNDFQILISNALGFINLLGDKLTDEQAFELVNPFFGDYQTMKNFYAIISNRYGKEGLYVTTISLGLYDTAINGLEALGINFANFFDAGTYTTNGLAFAFNSKAIISDAEDIESIIQKMDSIIPASYKEVKDAISA